MPFSEEQFIFSTMKNNKSQVLVVFLWLLLILTILAVSIAHRVAMATKIAGYEIRKTRAYAEAIKNLTLAISALNNNWKGFDRTASEQKFNDYVTIIDEQAKINLNSATEQTFSVLFENIELENYEYAASAAVIWRDGDDTQNIYDKYGSAKNAEFTNTQELILVEGIEEEAVNATEGLITALPSEAKLNINSVKQDTLVIILKALATTVDNAGDTEAESLANLIAEERGLNGAFKLQESQNNNIAQRLGNKIIADSPQENLLNALEVTDSSDYFLFAVVGEKDRIKVKISALYDKKNKKIIRIHES